MTTPSKPSKGAMDIATRFMGGFNQSVQHRLGRAIDAHVAAQLASRDEQVAKITKEYSIRFKERVRVNKKWAEENATLRAKNAALVVLAKELWFAWGSCSKSEMSPDDPAMKADAACRALGIVID